MRIALDAAPLSQPFGGIRRYVIELTRALAAANPGDTFILIADRIGIEPPGDLVSLANVEWMEPRPAWLGAKWWSLGLPWTLRRARVDVFHGTDFSVPYWGGVARVVTVHDLSPWKEAPICDGVSERVRRRGPGHVRRAERIVTPTESVAADVTAMFGVDRGRVRATHLGVTPLGAPDTPPVDRKPYFLYAGSRIARKNVGTLLAAWATARDALAEYSLRLTGHADREPGAHSLGNPTDTELAQILSGATAFVYPSLYEGFGLPVVEAMAAGVPVITSRDPALMEVTAGAALHVEATDEDAWSEALVRVAGDGALRADLASRGKHRATEFRWERTAKQTRDVYQDAIRSA